MVLRRPRWFFVGLGFVGVAGTVATYWVGVYLVLRGALTVGTIIAFGRHVGRGAYLGQLYRPMSALANAQVEFATSRVSFERVFEVLDLPVEIDNRPGATELEDPRGEVEFQQVWFRYAQAAQTRAGLDSVRRFGWRVWRPYAVGCQRT